MLALALATAALEAPLFWLCGYRRAFSVLAFAGVNIVSNLMLNGFLASSPMPWAASVAAGEAAVVLLEYCLCRYFEKGGRARLFMTLVATNAASCLAGLAFFGLFPWPSPLP